MQRKLPLKWFTAGCFALLILYVSSMAYATSDTSVAESPVPHIALLLPLDSPTLRAAAVTIQQGFLTASVKNQGLPVKIYSSADEGQGLIDNYHNAISKGAMAIVGPLTRGGIHNLTTGSPIVVPTLALNIVEDKTSPLLYFFGMAVDEEARQIARLAWQHGMKKAIVISAGDTLARRLQFAFEEQWTVLGGSISREIDYSDDMMPFSNIEATPDSMVFFATDTRKSRTIRPYLANNLALYGTSQLFADENNTLVNFDLNKVHFIDMPWLLQLDDPLVMSYSRANPPLDATHERLYALGIDAYRLVNVLLANSMETALPLDGVTGMLWLNDHIFQREAVPAIFEQGHAQLLDAPAPLVAPVFPGQPVNSPDQTVSSVTTGLPRSP